MSTAPCPRCGGLAPLGASFCPFCGGSLTAPMAGAPSMTPSTPGHYVVSGPLPPAPSVGSMPPPPPPGYPVGPMPPPSPYGGYGPPVPPSPSPATREVDQGALTYLLWSSVIWLCTSVVSVVLLVFGTPWLYSVHSLPHSESVSFHPAFYVVAVISGALSVAEVVLLRGAFRRLAPVDGRFSTPSTLALLLIIGSVVALAGLVPLVSSTVSLSGCIANSNNTTLPQNCGAIGALLVWGVVVLVGGVLALIGFIGCLIGIWRIGIRYRNDMFKVGAVLLIIPVINIVGAILILVASQAERSRLMAPGYGGPRPF